MRSVVKSVTKLCGERLTQITVSSVCTCPEAFTDCAASRGSCKQSCILRKMQLLSPAQLRRK
jgi:hypothetical protein